MISAPQLDVAALSAAAADLLRRVGIGGDFAPFTADAAWRAHLETLATERGALRDALYDVQDAGGAGSVEDALVDIVMNGSAVAMEDYPVARAAWEALGYELHEGGRGTHVVQVPAALRRRPVSD